MNQFCSLLLNLSIIKLKSSQEKLRTNRRVNTFSPINCYN